MSSAPKNSPDLVIEFEKVDRALADGLEDLLAAHWEEVALDQDAVPLQPDWQRYRQLEKQGVFKALSARRGGKLLGYNCFFVQPPIHYAGQLWALNDVLYLSPEARRGMAGARLIKAAEEKLAAIGVTKVIYHTKLHVMLGSQKSHPLGRLLKGMRYGQIEEVWAKRLKRDANAG